MRYKHDCENCISLAEFRNADLYFCRQGGFLPTVIARYSDEPSDYASGLIHADLPELKKAKELAIFAGLLT